jgi:MinD superfamily P-loop ATPase
MIVAVASGKGGTGKTTVAVNLALAVPGPVRLLDCDVEEPNCHIFLDPRIEAREAVCIPVPVVDEEKCTACGECGRICQYHAIVSLKTKPLVFPELCHGCGGCAKACPIGAISEVGHEIGVVETGTSGRVSLIQGRLNVGHPLSPPLIRAVKRHCTNGGPIIVDCPPGTSCPVIAALRGSHFVVLVTEPTPFGLHDLALAVETVRQICIPFGVIVNRADTGDGRVLKYCHNQYIPVLLEIPEDRRVAEAYSRGQAAVNTLPEYRRIFRRLWNDIEEAAESQRAAERIVHADV